MAFTISGTQVLVTGNETGASYYTFAGANPTAAKQLAPKAVEALFQIKVQNGAVFDTSDIVLVINSRVEGQVNGLPSAATNTGIWRCKGGMVLVQGSVNMYAEDWAIQDWENVQVLIQKTSGDQSFIGSDARATPGSIKGVKFIVKNGNIDAHLQLTGGTGVISDMLIRNEAANAGIIALRDTDTDGVTMYRVNPFGWASATTSFQKNMTLYNSGEDAVSYAYRRNNGGAIFYNCRNSFNGNRMTGVRYNTTGAGGADSARSVIVGAYKPTLQGATGAALLSVEVAIIKTSDSSIEQAGSTGADGKITIGTTASTDNRLLSYNNTFTSGGTNYQRKIAEAGTKYIKQSITPTTTGGNVLSVDQGTFKIVQRRADLNEISVTQSFATDYDGFKTMFADTSFTGTVSAASAITGVAFTVSGGAVTVTVTGAVTSQQIYNYWKYWSSLTSQMSIDQQLVRLISGDLKITGSLTTSAVITSVATAPTITATVTVSITGAGAITGTFTDSTGTRVALTNRNGVIMTSYVLVNGTPVGGATVGGSFVPGFVPLVMSRTLTVLPADTIRMVVNAYGYKPQVINCTGADLDAFTVTLEIESGVDVTSVSTITRDAVAATLGFIQASPTQIDITVNQTLAAYFPKDCVAGVAYAFVTKGYLAFAAMAQANNANIYSLSNGQMVTYFPGFKLRMNDTDSGSAAIVPTATGYSIPLVAYYFDQATSTASPVTILNASNAKIETAPWTQATATLSEQDKSSIAAKVDASTVLAKEATVATRASQASVTALGTPLQASSYTAPDNAGITAIKAKTDTLVNGPTLVQIEGSTILAKESTLAGKASQASVTALGTPMQAGEVVDANLVKVNDIFVDGTGTKADPWGPV